MLLAHVGGAWSIIGDDVWNPLWESGDLVEQRAWFVEQMLAEPPEVDPGSTFLYSNSGYMVVGAALEAATGSSWEELMVAHVFTPLGMDSCGFGPPDADGSLSEPWGHTTAGIAVEGTSLYADNPLALGPAGTVHCDLQDWGLFVAAHLAGARGESDWLRDESFSRLHTPILDDYALGWAVVSRSWAGALPAMTHNGTNTMFFTVTWLAPSRNQAWLVATNHGDGMSATDAVVGALLAR